MNIVDVLTTLASAKIMRRATAVPEAATSAIFAALGFAVRSLED